ncbi:hypothetical protein BRC91_06325 [Halobacteriales archaeon QS_4_62_28]|nr:MAG: hypothetical protein BRC91_06325 [Halobacteriales archaeon QS_4_62_28]
MTESNVPADTARSTIRAYYDALRNEEPLGPFFADGEIVKFGISETLVGTEAVREGLREQTRTTTDWAVESSALQVTERDDHARFADRVTLSWTDTERQVRYEFDTRWSGTLERRSDDGTLTTDEHATWRFVGMHVSTAGDV